MFDAMYGGSSQSSMSGMSMYSNSSVWSQLFDNKEILESQYTVLAGHWPESYNEVVLVVNENNEIDGKHCQRFDARCFHGSGNNYS